MGQHHDRKIGYFPSRSILMIQCGSAHLWHDMMAPGSNPHDLTTNCGSCWLPAYQESFAGSHSAYRPSPADLGRDANAFQTNDLIDMQELESVQDCRVGRLTVHRRQRVENESNLVQKRLLWVAT